MLFDVNAYIGHFPFRATERKTARDLIGLMDSYGIEKACVSSVSGVFYRDVMQGNYELLDEIAPYRDRLIPFCVIRPTYAQAKEDFVLCVKKLGFKGLKLFPRTNQYSLDCPESVEILKMAGDFGVPVQLPIYIEDIRQRHYLDAMTTLDAQEIRRAALESPDTDFILSNYTHQSYADLFASLKSERRGSFYYDTGRIDNLTQSSFTTVLRAAGADHVLFGTGSPLQYIDVQLVKLAFLPATDGASEDTVEDIRSRNLLRLLKMA